MPYISLDNLTQYNGRLRDYIDGSFDKLDGANWRKTSAAQSVSCWPIPESPLEPEVTFKFSEVSPESGDKGPDNPSTIVGVESVSCNVCESEGVNDTPYSIDLGGTYYGGTVNFATGVMEVTWYGEQINDAYTIYEEYTNTITIGIEATKGHEGNINNVSNFLVTDKFPTINGNGDLEHCRFSGGSGVARYVFNIYVNKSRLDVSNAVNPSSPTNAEWLAAAKVWISNNPVFACYKLFTPYTVPLTPVLVRSLPAITHYTPRQNTIYTPHESVQVGYAKSASKTSQDLANAIVALGGNV